MPFTNNLPVPVKEPQSQDNWPLNDSDLPFRETCMGDKKCLLCKLTGYHNHTPKSKELLMKQAAIGFIVLILLGLILVVGLMTALRMIGLMG